MQVIDLPAVSQTPLAVPSGPRVWAPGAPLALWLVSWRLTPTGPTSWSHLLPALLPVIHTYTLDPAAFVEQLFTLCQKHSLYVPGWGRDKIKLLVTFSAFNREKLIQADWFKSRSYLKEWLVCSIREGGRENLKATPLPYYRTSALSVAKFKIGAKSISAVRIKRPDDFEKQILNNLRPCN